MKADDLRVNQLIEVEMKYNEKKIILSSRIEGIENDYLLIATPIRKGVPLMASSGLEIIVQFRLRDTQWGFKTQVLDKRMRPIPIWLIKKPLEFFRVAQKRNWVRVDIALPVHFQYLDRDDDSTYQGLTVDISAGGILLSSAYQCHAGEKLKVDLFLTDKTKVSLVARVVRAFDKEQKALHGYLVALEFEDITEIQRDRIFKFVFEKQRENIRKGLLD